MFIDCGDVFGVVWFVFWLVFVLNVCGEVVIGNGWVVCAEWLMVD